MAAAAEEVEGEASQNTQETTRNNSSCLSSYWVDFSRRIHKRSWWRRFFLCLPLLQAVCYWFYNSSLWIDRALWAKWAPRQGTTVTRGNWVKLFFQLHGLPNTWVKMLEWEERRGQPQNCRGEIMRERSVITSIFVKCKIYSFVVRPMTCALITLNGAY